MKTHRTLRGWMVLQEDAILSTIYFIHLSHSIKRDIEPFQVWWSSYWTLNVTYTQTCVPEPPVAQAGVGRLCLLRSGVHTLEQVAPGEAGPAQRQTQPDIHYQVWGQHSSQYFVFEQRMYCISDLSCPLPVIGQLELMSASSANHRSRQLRSQRQSVHKYLCCSNIKCCDLLLIIVS